MSVDLNAVPQMTWHVNCHRGFMDGVHADQIPKFIAKVREELMELEAAAKLTDDIHPINEIRQSHGKPEGFAIELADCLIVLFNLAAMTGVNIEEAVFAKTMFNKNRAYRHNVERLVAG